MEMKGTNPLTGLNNNVQRIEASQQAGRTQQSGGDNSSSDQLLLSVQNQEVSHLVETAQSIPDVRESRVAQIRGEIESGNYHIKAEEIAEKIIEGNLIDEIF
jgi:negative regulator of flagellin synthesis FlgM